MATATNRRRSESSNDDDTLLESVQGFGVTAKRLASESYDTVKERANEYIEQGKEKARDVGQTMQGQIRDQPVKAVLIAAAAGFLVGAFMIRR